MFAVGRARYGCEDEWVGSPDIASIASRLADLPDVVGVVLGGSRARGTQHPDSDVDLGVVYRRELDTAAVGALARELAGPQSAATPLGAWGPWVDGGAWLSIGGVAVDWIYRDLDRIEDSVRRAALGEYAFHHQLGHPLGVPDFAYAGELAIGRVLEDRSGALAALKSRIAEYPPALRAASVPLIGQAEFVVGASRKVVGRDDPAYLAGCLFSAFGLTAHALHAAAGRWLINEKGAIAASAVLPHAPVHLAQRVSAVVSCIGSTRLERQRAVDGAATIIAEARTRIGA